MFFFFLYSLVKYNYIPNLQIYMYEFVSGIWKTHILCIGRKKKRRNFESAVEKVGTNQYTYMQTAGMDTQKKAKRRYV